MNQVDCIGGTGASFSFPKYNALNGVPAHIPYSAGFTWDGQVNAPFPHTHGVNWEDRLSYVRQLMPERIRAFVGVTADYLESTSEKAFYLMLVHELGHACPAFRRYRLFRSSSSTRAATQAAHTFYPPELGMNWCDPASLNSEYLATYANLFMQSGASRETFECFVEATRRYPRGRFSNAPAHCIRSICPRQQLEEAYASWFALRNSFNRPTEFFDSLYSTCGYARSRLHPGFVEYGRCFALTGLYRQAIREATNCSLD